MQRILDISIKDLLQIMRNRLTFLFMLIMPIAFTILFGLAFGGSGKTPDTRLPVGYLDQDGSVLSEDLRNLLSASTVLRLDETPGRSETDLATLTQKGKVAAAIVIPPGYGDSLRSGTPIKLGFHADPSQISTTTVESEILVVSQRLIERGADCQYSGKNQQRSGRVRPGTDMQRWLHGRTRPSGFQSLQVFLPLHRVRT